MTPEQERKAQAAWKRVEDGVHALKNAATGSDLVYRERIDAHRKEIEAVAEILREAGINI